MSKILIFDTSVLCCWLAVPGKNTCGPDDDYWDKQRIDTLIEDEQQAYSVFVLPIATIIETGNHITQINGPCYSYAKDLADKLRDTANEQSPWAAFTDQAVFWTAERMALLADEWPEFAKQGLSIADTTIKTIAEYYAQSGIDVEILTGDQGLQAYQPVTSPIIPRRRRRKS